MYLQFIPVESEIRPTVTKDSDTLMVPVQGTAALLSLPGGAVGAMIN